MKIPALLSCLALLVAAPFAVAVQSQPGKNTKPETAAMLERLKKLPTATAKDDAPPATQPQPQKSDTTGKTNRKIAKLLKGDPSKTDLAKQQLPFHALTAASLQLKESSVAGNGMSNFSASAGSAMHTGGGMAHGGGGSMAGATAMNVSGMTFNSALSLDSASKLTVAGDSCVTFAGGSCTLFSVGNAVAVDLAGVEWTVDFSALADALESGKLKLFKIDDLDWNGTGTIYISGLELQPDKK